MFLSLILLSIPKLSLQQLDHPFSLHILAQSYDQISAQQTQVNSQVIQWNKYKYASTHKQPLTYYSQYSISIH